LQPAVQLSDRFISTARSGFGFVEPVAKGNYNLLDARVSGWYDHAKETVFVDSIAVSQSPAKSAACRSNNISSVSERMACRWISGFDE
jgi:hypothetical protein